VDLEHTLRNAMVTLPNLMFVHYFAHVAVPFGEVVRRFESLDSQFGDWAGAAYRRGEELRARIGPGVDHVAKEVAIELGPGRAAGHGSVVYPIRWRATGTAPLFPRMSAELSISPIGSELTSIDFSGNYELPLGPLGRLIDRAMFGHVAEATVKDWVDRLAGALATDGRPEEE
jgi:hypothetical protein